MSKPRNRAESKGEANGSGEGNVRAVLFVHLTLSYSPGSQWVKERNQAPGTNCEEVERGTVGDRGLGSLHGPVMLVHLAHCSFTSFPSPLDRVHFTFLS